LQEGRKGRQAGENDRKAGGAGRQERSCRKAGKQEGRKDLNSRFGVKVAALDLTKKTK
jgi:hypothetical protein